MAFIVKSEITKRIIAGNFKEEEFHYVADEATGALVGKKAHSVLADAEAELAGLKGLEEGLEFAKAQFPGLSDKALIGKANVIAHFQSWQQSGKPVKTAEEAAADGKAAEEAAGEETAYDAGETF